MTETLSQAEWQYPVNRTETGWQTNIPVRHFGSEAWEAGRMQILELHAIRFKKKKTVSKKRITRKGSFTVKLSRSAAGDFF
jgi:hypothetical protein